MLVLRILLSPFAWLHALILRSRHLLYDVGVLPQVRPALPTIAIGNLALGGTGKTPMLEMVLRILKDTAPIATLSRGYGRKGTKLHEVQATDSAQQTGDEPLQVKRKFSRAHVFVGADRVASIKTMHQRIQDLQAVVLDDALQHRRLSAHLNILLTTWHRPYCDDMLFPAGTLRDVRSRAHAAQVVVVTKCPALPNASEQARWRHRLRLNADQLLFFSGIEYEEPVQFSSNASVSTLPILEHAHVLLFTGIADPGPLVDQVRSCSRTVQHVAFKDHHHFTPEDFDRLAGLFGKFAPGPKVLVTTEKDAARLSSVIKGSAIEDLPLLVIGMRAIILNEPERFSELIHHHVATHSTNS